MPPKRGKALSMNAGGGTNGPENGVSVALYVGLVLLLLVLFGGYYWFQVRGGLAAKKKHQISRRDLGVPNTQHRPAADPVGAATAAAPPPTVALPPEKALATMYVPKEVGHRTGQARVFITNKGLRVYETNEHGWPMPVPQASLNSQTPQ